MDSNDKQKLLNETLYSYIGYNNVEEINEDISDNTEDIKLIEVPKSLDKWFVEFNNDLKNKETKNKYKKKFKRIISKVAIIFLILFISIATLTVTVDAFRVKLFNTIIKNTEKYLDIEVKEESKKDNIEQNIDGFYELEYIPNGFEINYIKDLGDTKIVNYINNKNEEILFNQSPNGTKFQLDSEEAEVKEVDIMGNDGVILKKEGKTTLFWNNEEYSFHLLSTIDEEELISMAESLVKK
ncbi:DUF4367 domain-containing protein [Senegalia sp. (in: firmicutes)]|uniref:DUF4367 domain-containing protein n=1 Tax=Senegalia sp. (in: firmicutes) TaxID=1924098 RepID=UPI003F9ADFBC